jgi:hypothetical protein
MIGGLSEKSVQGAHGFQAVGAVDAEWLSWLDEIMAKILWSNGGRLFF